MEVILRRQPAGCVYWPLVIMTFGMVAVLISRGERHFIRKMDETGVWTRGGKRVGWSEFTRIERVRGAMRLPHVGKVDLSDEFMLSSPQGRVSLPFWRVENAREASEYFFRHLPPNLL